MKIIINKFKWILIIIFSLQCYLISHRVNFNFDILFNFYKPEVAIHKSIKVVSAIEIGNFLKKNKMNYSIESKFYKKVTDEYNHEENGKKFYQRLIEYTYPIKLEKNSKIIISNLKKIKNCKVLYNYKKKFINDCR